MSNTAIQHILDSKKFTVLLIAATNDQAQPFYVYLMLNKSKVDALENKLSSGLPVNLGNEGQVLASGKGHTPPEHVQQLIQEFFAPINQL